MFSTSIYWLFNAIWLHSFLCPRPLSPPSPSTILLPYLLHYTLGLLVMSVTVVGRSSGSLSRVLQSPLSHSELYSTDHPLVTHHSRVNKTRRVSTRGGRGGGSNAIGWKTTTPVHISNSRRQRRKKKSKCKEEHDHSVTKTGTISSAKRDSGEVKVNHTLTPNTCTTNVSRVHSQQQRSSSSLLPPVEAGSPQTAKRTPAKPKPVRRSKMVVKGVERVRGAWLGEGCGTVIKSLPAGTRKVSCGLSTGGSRTSRDVVLLSETESVSSIHSSLFTSSSSSTVHRGPGYSSNTRTTSTSTNIARFSRWTHNNNSSNSSSKPLPVAWKKIHTGSSASLTTSWGWGRGGGGGKGKMELKDVAAGLGRMSFRHVIVMSGAGISTPSGIPDFRTPGSGLYDNLQKYQLPEPSAIFETAYFHRNQRPFFSLAKELYPGRYCPSLAHCFVRLLQDKGVLLRNYTQNIDGLERLAGVEGGRLVEAHGSFSTASCTRCHSKQDPQDVKAAIFSDQIPKCKHCNGVVKPDIVFFGEDLPQRFHSLQLRDFSKCDLLVVMGTSLEVEPFASLVTLSRHAVPRVLLNRELVGPFRSQQCPRLTDVAVCRDVEESVRHLAVGAGWGDCLQHIHKEVTRINTGAADPEPGAASADSRSADSGCSQLMEQLNLEDTLTSSSSSTSSSISTDSTSTD